MNSVKVKTGCWHCKQTIYHDQIDGLTRAASIHQWKIYYAGDPMCHYLWVDDKSHIVASCIDLDAHNIPRVFKVMTFLTEFYDGDKK